MNEVYNEFNERKDEIDIYFEWIESQEDANQELFKILKSNFILMLYNLVESTISNAIETIHSTIYNESVEFDNLKSGLKIILIKQLKKNIEAKKFTENSTKLSKDIIRNCFDKKKVSNGNIDQKIIKEIGNEYGFSTSVNFQNSKNGRCLEVIKRRRNDLAHGTFSFKNVGKEYTIQEIGKMKSETINYLNEILTNIKSYLEEKLYKI